MRTGPVAVTGASGHVGAAVRRRLRELPNEVRPAGRGDDLRRALDGAVAVIHLAGTLAPAKGDTYESANLGTARSLAAAVREAGVERIAEVSYVDAAPRSPNAYLRAKGLGERELTGTGIPVTTVRCPWIFGPRDDPGPSFEPFVSEGGRPVTVIGDGTQRSRPVFVGDVAEAMVRAALDPAAPTGTFALAGPEELTWDGMVRLLNGDVKIRHVPPALARLLARLSPRLDPTLVEVLLADSLPRDPSAAEALGIEPAAPSAVLAG